MIRKSVVIALSAILSVIIISCTISYKFNGASIDYNVTKTISIANFPIRAALVYPPLAAVFNNALQDIYTRQTRLSIVPRNGDLQVEGEITGYSLSPQAVNANAHMQSVATRANVRINADFLFIFSISLKIFLTLVVPFIRRLA